MCPFNRQIVHKMTFVVFFCLSTVFCFVYPASSASDTLKLTILYMNDPHAHYSAEVTKDGAGLHGGFAKAQSVISDITQANRQEGRQTIFLLAGDLLTGTSYSTVFKGTMGVELLNTMNLTAMVVGNHEFDYGITNLLENLKPRMKFPLLSANILNSEGKGLFEPYIVKRFEDSNACVLIMGLTTTRTPVTTSPKNVEKLEFLDPEAVAKQILANAPTGCMVIALTHIGFKQDRLLAAAVPQINVIIGGHSHTKVDEPQKVGDTLVCQASAYAEYVGRLDLDFKDGRILSYQGKLVPLDPSVREEKKISALIEDYKKRMGPELEKPLGVTDIFLDGSRSSVRSDNENDLCTLIAGIMATAVGADISFLNGGAIRNGLNQGVITMNDVYSALPFDDAIVKMDLKGSTIEALLQNSLELPQGSGGKLKSFGIRYLNSDGKVRLMRIRGAQFDPSKSYSVAISEFLASGGDGYQILRDNGENRLNSGLIIRDLLVNYIKDKKTVTEKEIESFKTF